MPPLRPRGEGTPEPNAPEALMISALVDSGTFNPWNFHIEAADLACWDKVWKWCQEHQDKSGRAPALNVLLKRFPDFDYTENVPLDYAAHQLRHASSGRKLRGALNEAINLVREDDLDSAWDTVEALRRPYSTSRQVADLFDHSWYEEEFEGNRLEIPYPTLSRAVGGIGPGELWYFAARPGQGKTMNLCWLAAHLVKTGPTRVTYLSLEMPTRTINKRVLRFLARKDKKVLAMFDSEDRGEIKKGVDIIRERVPGQITVLDPRHVGRTPDDVRSCMDNSDVVIVDHVGLMKAPDGRRAIDDWRVQATISNMLKEHTLSTGVPIVAAAQLNRLADNFSDIPPKLSQLAQSDALGQDADVVVTSKKLSKRVTVSSAEKIREGADSFRWFSLFDVAAADLSEITREKANDLRDLDAQALIED